MVGRGSLQESLLCQYRSIPTALVHISLSVNQQGMTALFVIVTLIVVFLSIHVEIGAVNK